MREIGQIIGYIAMLVSMTIYFRRKRKEVLMLKLSTDVLWASHHLLISSFPAAATTTFAIFREIVFYNYDKKWAKSGWWKVFFSAGFIVAALLTWKDYFSIVPAAASVLSTIAFGSKKLSVTKTFSFLSSVGMLVYGIHYGSSATVVNECLTEASILISVVTNIVLSEKNKNEVYENE